MKKKVLLIISAIVLVTSCSTNKNAVKNPFDAQTLQANSSMIDAITALNNGEIAKAESIYRQISEKDPDNAAVWYYLSSISFQKQDVKESIDYGKRAIKLNDTNVWYKLQLADVYLATQKYDEGADMFENIVKQNPSVIEYWMQLQNIYHVNQDFKKELNTLDRMEKRFGVNEMTSMQKYNIYREVKDNSKAEAEIKKLANAYPSQSKYWSILAEMQMKEKNYDKAFEYYKKVEQTDPDNELLNFTYANYYLVKNNEDSLYYYLKKAAAQEQIDFSTKINIIFSVYKDKVDTDSIAFQRFFSLLETMKNTADTTNAQLWGMLVLGYMRQDDFQNAAYSAQKAIDLGRDNFDIYTSLLYASSTFEEPSKMIEIADKTIEIYPEQPLPYLFKGVNQMILEDYENALETLTMGLSKSGRDKAMKEDFYMNLGDCYHALGQNDKCFENYKEVLNINPNNYVVLNNYSYYLCLNKQELDKALEYIEKVISEYPDNLTFADTYAWVLYQRGEYKTAKDFMQNYLSQRSDWSEEMENHYKAILNKAK